MIKLPNNHPLHTPSQQFVDCRNSEGENLAKLMRMNQSICTSALHRLVRESDDLAKPHFSSHLYIEPLSFTSLPRLPIHCWSEWFNRSIWTRGLCVEQMQKWRIGGSWQCFILLGEDDSGEPSWLYLPVSPNSWGLGPRWSITPSPLTWSSGWVRKERLPTVLLATFWWITSANWKDPISGPQLCKMVKLGLEPTTASF